MGNTTSGFGAGFASGIKGRERETRAVRPQPDYDVSMTLTFRLLLAGVLAGLGLFGQPRQASLRLGFGTEGPALEIEKMALGQGGLSEEPMWENRVAEIRALRPAMIRLFVQEYFDLLPARGRYHFDTLDRSVELILRTGATPALALAFKPALLFPKVDQDIVEPNDYAAWQELIVALVKRYQGRVRYWEVGNEPDLGEPGGCPFRFQPESYVRFYEQTAAAIRQADSQAKVGGPALANWRSPLLPALLQAAAAGRTPLDFVSWHIYNSDPLAVRATIEGVKALVAQHPGLKPELILNEWNMSLANPVLDPRFQPAFILETIWQMKEGGLDYSCYYHIRDYHVQRATFARFLSPEGASAMARWWNRMPQFDGLFDYQNALRPAYFAFKLLSRERGAQLAAQSNDPKVHAFFTYDAEYRTHNLLVWNFSEGPVRLHLDFETVPSRFAAHRRMLDAETASSDENHRLRPLETWPLTPERNTFTLDLGPYGIEYWEIVPGRR